MYFEQLRSRPPAGLQLPPSSRLFVLTKWRIMMISVLMAYYQPRWVLSLGILAWRRYVFPLLQVTGVLNVARTTKKVCLSWLTFFVKAFLRTTLGQYVLNTFQRQIHEWISKLHQFTEQKVYQGTARVLDHLRKNMKDPDMPDFIHDAIDETINMITPDVMEEVSRKTNEILIYYRNYSRLQLLTSPNKWRRIEQKSGHVNLAPSNDKAEIGQHNDNMKYTPDAVSKEYQKHQDASKSDISVTTSESMIPKISADKRGQQCTLKHSISSDIHLDQKHILDKPKENRPKYFSTHGERKLDAKIISNCNGKVNQQYSHWKVDLVPPNFLGEKSSVSSKSVERTPSLNHSPKSLIKKTFAPCNQNSDESFRGHPQMHQNHNLNSRRLSRKLFPEHNNPVPQNIKNCSSECAVPYRCCGRKECQMKFSYICGCRRRSATMRHHRERKPHRLDYASGGLPQQSHSAFKFAWTKLSFNCRTRLWYSRIRSCWIWNRHYARSYIVTCFQHLSVTIRQSIHNTRAWILYTLNPYDRSIWNCMKDPWWIALNGIGIIPQVGTIWWLFLFTIRDNTDEHQVAEFIAGFQTARFLSQGLWGNLRGTASLIWCTHHKAEIEFLQQCKGPTVSLVDILFFLLQILIVSTTFYKLSQARRMAYTHTMDGRMPTHILRLREAQHKKFCAQEETFNPRINLSTQSIDMKAHTLHDTSLETLSENELSPRHNGLKSNDIHAPRVKQKYKSPPSQTSTYSPYSMYSTLMKKLQLNGTPHWLKKFAIRKRGSRLSEVNSIASVSVRDTQVDFTSDSHTFTDTHYTNSKIQTPIPLADGSMEMVPKTPNSRLTVGQNSPLRFPKTPPFQFRFMRREVDGFQYHYVGEGRVIQSGPGNSGGHLFKLFLYDVGVLLIVFILVAIALLVESDEVSADDRHQPTEVGVQYVQNIDLIESEATALSHRDWKLYSQLFWIRVISGYLAFPFIFFKIPVLNTLLLHTSRTGYNRHGCIVPVIKLFTPPNVQD